MIRSAGLSPAEWYGICNIYRTVCPAGGLLYNIIYKMIINRRTNMERINQDLNITWLGHAGFVIEAAGIRLVVDPYLSDSLRRKGMARSFPPPLSAERLEPDVICCTSNRPYHFDEETILALYKRYPKCIVAGPDSVIGHCKRLGFNSARTILLKEGTDSYSYDRIDIKAVKAFQAEDDAIGAAVTMGGYKIYISGDARRKAGLEESVLGALGGSPDIAMVCINGRNGNMDDVDAFRLVRALNPKAAVPINYGMFVNNTADPRDFIDAVGKIGIDGIMMKPGRKVRFSYGFDNEKEIAGMELEPAIA